MQTIFLSPHFDDIALSCGGLVWQAAGKGEAVSIWTICAGEIPPGPLSDFAEKLHARWQTGREAVAQRRVEDAASCQIMGASHRWLDVPDCIYRSGAYPSNTGKPGHSAAANPPSTYPSLADPESAGEVGHPAARAAHLYTEETLMGPVHPAETPLIQSLAAQLRLELPAQAQVVSPLALGGHVDHRLVRAVAEMLGRPLLYYADYPYVLHTAAELEHLRAAGWHTLHYPISTAALYAWQQSVAAHASQISSFWPDMEAMRWAIAAYSEQNQGVLLWQAPNSGR